MPWSMSNPPPPAKNWTPAQKRRCIAAGNRALSDGKPEQDAIFACIGAAGKSRRKAKREGVTKAQVALYDKEQAKIKPTLEKFAQDYLTSTLTLLAFKASMQKQIKQFYIRTALIAKGKHKFTQRDKADLQKFLGLMYGYLDGFVKDLGEYKALVSDQGVVSRASSYGVGWGVFSRFSIPGELADMLPDLPGISCLGNGDCGCILEYDSDEEGYNIYWVPNPFKEHCVICADLAIEWDPYKISFDELEAEYGGDIFNEEGDFIEF